MADNVTANAGSGGATFRAVSKTNIEAPVCVIDIGGAGAEILLTAGQQLATASMPVVLTASQITTLTPYSSVGITGSVAVTGTFWQATQPVSGTFWQATQPVSIATLPALAAGSAVIGHVIVDSGTITAVTAITNALPSGTNVIGHVIVDSGTVTTVSTVTAVTAITNALPAGTNNIGFTSPASATTGGATPYKYIIAAGSNQDSQNVKASAGTLYNINAYLNVATLRYLKLYDKGSAPTSSDTPVHTIIIPGNTAGAGVVISLPTGMAFASGIGFRVTTGLADNDTGAATANDGVVNLSYK